MGRALLCVFAFVMFGPAGLLAAVIWICFAPSRRPILVQIEQPKPRAEPLLFRFFDWCAARGWMK